MTHFLNITSLKHFALHPPPQVLNRVVSVLHFFTQHTNSVLQVAPFLHRIVRPHRGKPVYVNVNRIKGI
jgi:hypothetical protein